MLKYINKTDKYTFKENMEWCGQKITPFPSRFTCEKRWKISDRFSNQWDVSFADVGWFSVYGEDFILKLYLEDKNIEIHCVYANGKKLTADRYLRKYEQIACMISNYFIFGYFCV